MNSKKKLALVKQFIEQGFGRRRIAKVLEITEWEARGLMAKAVGVKKKRKRGTQYTDTKVDANRLELIRNNSSKNPTTVQVVSSASQDTAPNKLDTYTANLKVAVLSDIHYPYEDEKSELLTKNFLSDYKPDIIILNGDITDCYSISSFSKDIKKKMDIQEELDYGRIKLQEWTNLFPETDIKYLEGNHENRFSRLIKNNAPALASLRTLNIEENLNLKDMGIEWIPEWQDLQIGNIMFIHGHMVRKHGGGTARAHFEKYGCSLLLGHCHRASVTYKRNKFGTHALIENGCLCDFDIEYARFPDWHQGFTTLDFDGNDFSVNQYLITNHKLIANGKVYTI